MFPIRDDQPRTTTPYVTYSIIAINLAIFGYEVWLGVQDPKAWYGFLMRYSQVPHHFQLAFQGSSGYTIGGAFLTIFTSMFLHAGWLHVLVNMWFLRIFGDNVEDHFGHAAYALFYLFCGFIGSMAQLFASPTSEIPSLGASGAIAGVMGAYLLRYPNARIQVVWAWFGGVFWMRAIGMLFYWFALPFVGQIFTQLSSSATDSGGVGYLAHLGGFLTGLVMIKVVPGRSEYAYGGWTKRETATATGSDGSGNGSTR
jgi:membrane associated rhomboid family serine protease